jgi:hypothetical protein
MSEIEELEGEKKFLPPSLHIKYDFSRPEMQDNANE